MPVGEDVSVDSLVVDTEGYSGAEVSNHGTTHTTRIVHYYLKKFMFLFYWVYNRMMSYYSLGFVQ